MHLRLPSHAAGVFCLTLVVSSISLAEFKDRPIRVTQADRERAYKERPFIFGMTLIWDGRSERLSAEEFNRLMRQRALEAGVTIARFGFDWADLEREPGEYDWDAAERKKGLNRLFEAGIEVLGLVCTSPGWANQSHKPSIHPPREEAAERFVAFCTALAKRYAGRIRHYEFWNEHDVCGWLPKPDAHAYTVWLKRCYRGLKAGNRECLVGTGGHLGRDTGFLKTIYADGGKNFLDAVSIHPYPPYEHPQGARSFDWKMVEDYRAVMVAHGDGDKPMWCTEYGWLADKIGHANQAKYITEALDYMVSYPFITVGIHHVLADWHQGSSGLMGLCDRHLEPRPAYGAWARYVQALTRKVRPDEKRSQ